MFLQGESLTLMVYHMRALCNEKEPNIPGAEGRREARSLYQH